MRIAIMGAGGVGSYFGARLAASGEDVTASCHAKERPSGGKGSDRCLTVADLPVPNTASGCAVGGAVSGVQKLNSRRARPEATTYRGDRRPTVIKRP